MRKELDGTPETWMRERGIPFAPEVNGFGKDGALPDEVVTAMSALMTNTDGPIFAFTQEMPPEVAAALFARYSRSPRPLRLVLAREFMSEKGLGLDSGKTHARVTDDESVRGLFERVLVEYGDDSVAQLGSVQFAAEWISQLAVKEIEDGRLGSYLEKSTRYVDFGNKINGSYLYVRPREIAYSPVESQYETVMDEAFELYGKAYKSMLTYLGERYPKPSETDEKVYRASLRAKAFDLVRVFLPMSTLTNVGVSMSAHAVEQMVNKMSASPLEECREVGQDIYYEVSQVMPSLVSRAGNERYGGKAQRYLFTSRYESKKIAHHYLERIENTEWEGGKRVELVDAPADNVTNVVAAILYPHAETASLSQVRELAQSLTEAERQELIHAYVSGRTDRRHRPGRAFEEAVYTFGFTGNVGVWRDLQRHRMLTQQRQLLTTRLGYEIPEEFSHIEIDGAPAVEVYSQHMEKRNQLFEDVSQAVSPEVAQYVVAFGHRMHWTMTLNAREAYHMIPLRAGAAGHPKYREIAREMFYAMMERDPMLVMPMAEYIDFSDEPRLERLTQLSRVKAKMEALSASGGDTFSEGE